MRTLYEKMEIQEARDLLESLKTSSKKPFGLMGLNPGSHGPTFYCSKTAEGTIMLGQDYPLRQFLEDLTERPWSDADWQTFLESQGLNEDPPDPEKELQEYMKLMTE